MYTEFLGSKKAPPPLKSAALFGRTPRTCLRPALKIETLLSAVQYHHRILAVYIFLNYKIQNMCHLTCYRTIIFRLDALLSYYKNSTDVTLCALHIDISLSL